MLKTNEPILGNEAFQEALNAAANQRKATSEVRSGKQVRLPIDIPVSYKRKLKMLAVVNDTTMRELVLEALEAMFKSEDKKP